MAFLRTLFCLFITALASIVLFPVAMLMMLVTWSRQGEMWLISRVWSKILILAGGATIELIGSEHLNPKRPTIYISNHQSTLDIPVLLNSLWPVKARFIIKQSLKHVPVTGWYMNIAGHIYVYRSDSQAAVATLAAAANQVCRGTSIAVFPEGTRSETGVILPFKKGPFALAAKAGVAICPITIEGTRKVMPKNSWRITPGPVKVKIGNPIDARLSGNDCEALMRVVRDAIIAQSLELGGKGGDRDDFVAARGKEGIGAAFAAKPPLGPNAATLRGAGRNTRVR